ncbi:hypothetical protein Tco_1537888 [Tanacetum coccineum]
MANRYKGLKEDHLGCDQKLKAFEQEKNELSVVNKDQTLQIQELEAELPSKDSALAAAEKMSVDGAKKRQNLVAQLSKAEVEKFDCIPGWGSGLSEGRTDEDILNALCGASNFDAYSDKKLYPMYDKLFKKEYPFIIKIANGYRHSVYDLLKVSPDPAPSDGTSVPTISTSLAGPPDPLVHQGT